MIDSIASTIAQIASWILFASCKSVFVISLVMLCQRLLRRWLPPQGRYALWFAVIACLTVPVGAQLDMNLLRTPTSAADKSTLNKATQVESSAYGSFTFSIGDPQRAKTADSSPIKIQSWLVLLWLAAAFGLMMVVLRNFVRYRTIKSSSENVDSNTWALFEHCKSELNVSCHVHLLETDQIESPAMFGWLSPTLLLPRDLSKRLTDNQLRLVFLHELCHVQRHDILVNWLIACVQIVYWFNPAVWYALRAMRTDMEQACDAKVMGHLSAHEQISYGDTLIHLSDFNQRRTLLPQGADIVESQSQLKERITMIAQFKPHKAGHSLFAAVVLLAVTSVAVTQLASGAATASTPQTTIEQTPTPKAPEPQAETKAAKTTGASNDLPATARPVEAKSNALAPTKPSQPAPSTVQPATTEPLELVSLPLRYINAQDLMTFIQPNTGLALLSERGSASIDERTNTLLVNDTQERIATIQQLVKTLDVRIKQIRIEAYIVLADPGFSQDLAAKTQSTMTKVPPYISQISSNYDVSTELKNAKADYRVDVIASPRIITLNRQEATIKISSEIPDQTAEGQVPSKRSELTLKLTPRITADQNIALDAQLTIDTGQFVATPLGANVPSMRRIATQIMTGDGQTIMLGDMLERDRQDGADTALASQDVSDKRQLLIFLTPKIVTDLVAQW